MTCGPDAGVPEGAELEVDEILSAEFLEDGESDPYQDYASMLRDTLGWECGSASYLRLFDIRIVDRDGRKVVISAGVDVKIELADMENGEESDLRVVHFADGADTGDVVRGVEVEGDAVLFTATGFSAYAIVEGPEVLPLSWTRVSSLEEMIEKGSGGLYIGNPEGFCFTNSLIIDTDSKKRTGIAKTTPARSYPASDAALYWFEQAGGTNNYSNPHIYSNTRN